MSRAVGYNDDDNARRAVRMYIPGKYRMRLGDAQYVLRTEVDIDILREDSFIERTRPLLLSLAL